MTEQYCDGNVRKPYQVKPSHTRVWNEAVEAAAKEAEANADQNEDTVMGRRINSTALDIAAAIRRLRHEFDNAPNQGNRNV